MEVASIDGWHRNPRLVLEFYNQRRAHLTRIERGDGTTKDLDLLLELAGSMGLSPGTTICGLADGNNWAVRTIVNKYRSEFEARLRPRLVPVRIGA